MQYNHKRGNNMALKRAASVLLLASFILILFLIFHRNPASGASEGQVSVRYISIQIEEGDTLWDLAARYKPSSEDITHYMQRIRKVNHLTDSCLIAEEYLIIPLYDVPVLQS